MPTESTYSYNQTLFVSQDFNGIDYGDLNIKLPALPITSANFEYVSGWPQDDGTVLYVFTYDDVLSEDDQHVLSQFIHDYIFVPMVDTCVFIRELQSVGVNAGTFTSGQWQVRTLNSIVGQQVFASVDTSTNQFTLQPGTYSFNIHCPASGVGAHHLRVKNITDNVYAYGANAFSKAGDLSIAPLHAYFTMKFVNTFQVEHYCATTVADTGLGFANNLDPGEIYSTVFIHQINSY